MRWPSPAEFLAWWRVAKPGERPAFLCILAAVLVGILGLVFVDDGSIAVLPVALMIVALIFLAGWFHMRGERGR